MVRKCLENPIHGYYHCMSGCFVNGVRCCSEYGLKIQKEYCGHYFCAFLGDEFDESQLSFFEGR